jgi:hypothetical protein
VNTPPTGPTAADRPAGDAAALIPTAHTVADHVTAREIAEFLRHLTRFHSLRWAVGGDPADHAALLARKAELLARIADHQAHASSAAPTTPMAPMAPTAPEGPTP